VKKFILLAFLVIGLFCFNKVSTHRRHVAINKLISAQLAMRQTNWSEAINLCKGLIDKDSKNKPALICYIRALTKSGQFATAHAQILSYTKRFHKDKHLLTEEARYYAMTDQYMTALALLKPLLQQDPTNDNLLDIEQYVLVRNRP
jgi:predicted Zn-dependent protease